MTPFNLRRLGYACGAEITGLDLRRPLGSETVAAVRRAWLDHLVLCFPDQDLAPDEFGAFAAQFGELDDNRGGPQHRIPENPNIGMFVNQPIEMGGKFYKGGIADLWHSDQSYTSRPSTATLLNAKDLPEAGGNTLFANTYLGYETLSEKFRRTIEGLEGIHDFSLSPNAVQRGPELQARIIRENPPIAHPLVRVHPETKKKSLYVGNRISGIDGLTDEEARPILDFLTRHATRYEFVYRHVWRKYDVVMWDNRCTLHFAVQDYDRSELRRLLRCTIFGEKSGRLVGSGMTAAASAN